MQRSSPTIGAIAAALAKAQLELQNPEKSLTAVIRSPFPREEERSFRYAPLSSGLDLVRKCLGRYEIATVQTTTIDETTGLIRLTTTLAHSSGEWVASDWPVCPVTETAAPHRLGAALTYARRYGLFTLVGIAGDDDLDAPDLAVKLEEAEAPPSPPRTEIARRASAHRKSGLPVEALPKDASTALREQLVGDLKTITSPEDLSAWAKARMPEKNRLAREDATEVEEAFAAIATKIAGLAPGSEDATHEVVPPTPEARPLPPKTIRLRDERHRRFVARQPCLICGRSPSDAHHLKFAQPRAMGRKVSDEFTVPICRTHHRELHRYADERAWWDRRKINPLAKADSLWKQSQREEIDVSQ